MNKRRQACAAQHFGLWMIEPTWFVNAVRAVKAGLWKVTAVQPEARTPAPEDQGYSVADGGVAQIDVHGQLQKGSSSFGGTGTVAVRQAIRRAAQDGDVAAILLHVDSPGGTVAGTAELAGEVARADKQKPVHAYIEDMGASAAYWIASQARRVAANATGLIGSIGTIAVLEDTSGKAEQEGVSVHVLSTGAYKGAGWPGSPITEEHLEYWQELVEQQNEFFLKAVQDGRGMSRKAVEAVADGRIHMAARAQDMGLVDSVEAVEHTLKVAARDGRAEARGRKGTEAVDRRLRMVELEGGAAVRGDARGPE